MAATKRKLGLHAALMKAAEAAVKRNCERYDGALPRHDGETPDGCTFRGMPILD